MSSSFFWQKFQSPSRFPSPFSVLFLQAKLGEHIALWLALTPPPLKWLTEQKNPKSLRSLQNMKRNATNLLVILLLLEKILNNLLQQCQWIERKKKHSVMMSTHVYFVMISPSSCKQIFNFKSWRQHLIFASELFSQSCLSFNSAELLKGRFKRDYFGTWDVLLINLLHKLYW